MKQVYKTTVKTVAICFAIFLFTFKANSQTTNAEKFQLTPSVGTWFNITSPIASNRLDFNNRIPGQDVNLMTLLNNGNVGIGTTMPYRKFEVRGEGVMEKIIFRTPTSGAWFNIDAPNGGNRLDFNLGSGSDTKMTILSNGNIGIGTTNPESKLHVDGKVQIGNQTITSGSHNTNDVKLTVDGHAIFKKVIVTQNSWADFVFDKDYKLKPLEEVEKFISKNNHLPDVPSESDVIENGISLGDMDAILLQKIEELTLYMIDLEKQNQLLNKEISKLKKNK